MPVFIGQYAVTATAVNIATALTLPDEVESCRELLIQYNEDAANDAFLGKSTVATTPTDVGWKFPVVAANIPPQPYRISAQGAKSIDLRTIYLIGTVAAGNIFFITIVY